MHDHISIAYNSKRSTGVRFILALFNIYRIVCFWFQKAFGLSCLI